MDRDDREVVLIASFLGARRPTSPAARARLALRPVVLAGCLALALGCSEAPELSPRGGSTLTTSGSSSTGRGGAGPGGYGGAASEGGGGAVPTSLEALLAELRADRDAALLAHAAQSGWPVPIEGGFLFVSAVPALQRLAGDHDAWAGTPMNQEADFAWLVLEVAAGSRYKFGDGASEFRADPFARAFSYDDFGEMSLVAPEAAHLERHLAVGDTLIAGRTLRVHVPEGTIGRVLYVHDGQNLFDPEAPWGGWRLSESAPPGALLVGIDNGAARMDEYTHVEDELGGSRVGGLGDAYADYLQHTVRPLIRAHYGEPGPIGLMGSSLGGLVSLHVADRYPGEYAFAASLSGTLGWGSIGLHNETLIERYAAHGHGSTVLYLDSGGEGASCADGDGDGIHDDDPDATDNYCETEQMREVLGASGYQEGQDLFYWWEPGAPHDEAAWAARVSRPLQVFSSL